MNKESKILLFFKGFLMGICDIIPGISGGTIAFITGIYERLMNSIKSFSPKLIVYFFNYLFKKKNKKELKEGIKKLDLIFLGILILGILIAFLLVSRIISVLLETYFAYTVSFFIGLILASSKIIFDNIKKHNFKNIIFGFIGFILGILLVFLIPFIFNILLVFLIPLGVNPIHAYVFFGGFIAISAMFLPGISGAFILLILGLYEFMLSVLHDIPGKFSFFIIFIIGAILGAMFISRIISFVFKKDKCKTLYLLLGLVIGALSIPIRRLTTLQLGSMDIFIMLGLFILGIFLVVIINSLKKDVFTSS